MQVNRVEKLPLMLCIVTHAFSFPTLPPLPILPPLPTLPSRFRPALRPIPFSLSLVYTSDTRNCILFFDLCYLLSCAAFLCCFPVLLFLHLLLSRLSSTSFLRYRCDIYQHLVRLNRPNHSLHFILLAAAFSSSKLHLASIWLDPVTREESTHTQTSTICAI